MVARTAGRTLPTALRVAAVALAFASAPATVPVAAEVVQTVTVEAFQSLSRSEDGETAAGFGRAVVDLRSSGGGAVRGRVQLEALLGEEDGESIAEIEVPRAEIRTLIPLGARYSTRLTVGRTRLTWGEGQVYNAGDVINGSSPESIDLSAETLRDETQWTVAMYLPIGPFSFLEPILFVPVADIADGTPADADRAAAGFRAQGQIRDVKAEAGYLFRGVRRRHVPFASLQGNLGIDLYGAGSFDTGRRRDESDGLGAPIEARDILTVTAGAFHSRTSRRGGLWSGRLESIWRVRDGDLDTATVGVFPDLQWAPSQLFAVIVRGEIVLVEDGATAAPDRFRTASTAGLAWTPSTGLRIATFVSAATGGAHGAPGGGATSATLSLRHTF